MTSNLRTNRMSTSIERVFRPLPGGLYREITLKFINFLNDDGSIKSSKMDGAPIEGGLYKAATNDRDRSTYGEVMYTFPGHDNPTRLLAIGKDFSDYRYGRE